MQQEQSPAKRLSYNNHPRLLTKLENMPLLDGPDVVRLAMHGCIITEKGQTCIIEFPLGTTWQQKLPRIHTDQIQIKLPDGYELRYINDHGKKFLQFPINS
jgi:hypothetical protein